MKEISEWSIGKLKNELCAENCLEIFNSIKKIETHHNETLFNSCMDIIRANTTTIFRNQLKEIYKIEVNDLITIMSDQFISCEEILIFETLEKYISEKKSKGIDYSTITYPFSDEKWSYLDQMLNLVRFNNIDKKYLSKIYKSSFFHQSKP